MKQIIRLHTFETNSSSTHSLTVWLQDDFKDWVAGKGYWDDEGNRFISIKDAISELSESEKISKIVHLLTKKLDILKGQNDFKKCQEMWDLLNIAESLEDFINLAVRYKITLIDILKPQLDTDRFWTYDEWVNTGANVYHEDIVSPSGDKLTIFGKYRGS